MSEIKPGTIANIKISDEPVYVLAIQPLTGFHQLQGILSGVLAKVRRPNVDEKGSITHKVEEFFIEELESREDAAIRKVTEIDQLKAEIKAKREAENPAKLSSAN